ncbi:MAG: RNA polymerase sigma factor [Blastocatellia bacterium]
MTTEADPTILSDEELLHRMRGGDEEAFLTLYRRRQKAIYRFAWRMSGSGSVAEDVTQETFMILLRGNGKYDSARGSFSAYLFGIARNQVLRRLEKDRGMLPLEPARDDAASRAQDRLVAAEDPLRDLTRRETIESVRQAVLALPMHYREAVVLCDLHEMSYLEAAAILNCAVGTVRSRLHRGRGMLVERLRGTETQPQGGADSVTCFI